MSNAVTYGGFVTGSETDVVTTSVTTTVETKTVWTRRSLRTVRVGTEGER